MCKSFIATKVLNNLEISQQIRTFAHNLLNMKEIMKKYLLVFLCALSSQMLTAQTVGPLHPQWQEGHNQVSQIHNWDKLMSTP